LHFVEISEQVQRPLPTTSWIHLVFDISLLKPCVGYPNSQICSLLISFQIGVYKKLVALLTATRMHMKWNCISWPPQERWRGAILGS
jgi:hypothetical protein